MKAVRFLLALAYPFLVFAALLRFEPRILVLGLGVVGALRAATLWRRPGREALGVLLLPALLFVAVLAATWVSNDPLFLFLVPALVNAALLVSFGRTLFGGPSFVETIARLQHPDLSDVEARYCDTVTRVWCAFFLANGAVCAWLALAGDAGVWALYTGLLSYLLIGLLFAVEFVVRSQRFGRYEGTLVELLFRRLFPRDTAT